MSEVYTLSQKQINKVARIISDYRARYIEIPSTGEISKAVREGKQAMVKVLQGDGQVIGEITLKQAYHIN